ncbi:UNVERIFIED_CONTAM: hypothetical protein K2H54_034285 [Gekko kuhli]
MRGSTGDHSSSQVLFVSLCPFKSPGFWHAFNCTPRPQVANHSPRGQANSLMGLCQSLGQQLVILQGARNKKWPFDSTLYGNQFKYDASINHAFIIIHRQPMGILNMFS